MAEADHRNFEFGEYRLLTEDGTLWSGDERIQVTQKALELLTVLLENPGRVVSRDEITERLWPETFVDENNLSVTVSMLRKAFGVQAAELIETIPRKGYRLNAEVAVSSNSAMVIEREFTRTTIEKIQIDDPETSRAIAQLKARSNRQGYVLGFVVLCLISIISLIVWEFHETVHLHFYVPINVRSPSCRYETSHKVKPRNSWASGSRMLLSQNCQD